MPCETPTWRQWENWKRANRSGEPRDELPKETLAIDSHNHHVCRAGRWND